MKRVSSLISDDGGSISVWTVILLAVFFGILAYVVDLGHLHTVQSELRNAADTCALRGARAFLPDSIPVDGASPIPMAPDPLNAETQASLAIGVNRSDNKALTYLPTDEIQVGIWDYETSGWLGGSPVWTWPPDSSFWGRYIGPGITLITRRDGAHNGGPVGMTLAQLFMRTTVAVGGPNTTRATAALSGWGGPTSGGPTLPFGPMRQYITANNYAKGDILHGTFNSNTTNNIGWTNLDPNNTNPNANELKKIMQYGAQCDCPPGSPIGVQNGVDASVILWMVKPGNIFELQPTYDPKVYNNTSSEAPIFLMPIFDPILSQSGNFNQSGIAGGMAVQVVEVGIAPNNYIDVRIVTGDYIAPGYGGGAWYGVLATEPKLVQ